jgi:hypothetical protein
MTEDQSSPSLGRRTLIKALWTAGVAGAVGVT